MAREGQTKTVAPKDFQYTYDQIPHHRRAPLILEAHQEIRELLGRKNPWTFAVILGCVALQGSAVVFHLSRGEAANTPFNILLIALAVFVAWGRRK